MIPTNRRLALTIPALAGLALLAQCSPSDADTCARAEYEGLIGTNIAAVTLPADPKIRVIGPDDLVTTDFIEDRVNIEFDASGEIVRITCG